MFAPAIQHDTGLRVMDINLISIASELGMYFPVPLVGYIGDTYGPACIGILSTLLFAPGYYISSIILQSAQQKMAEGAMEDLISPVQFNILLACFACIGTATSSLHFCGVVTAARVLPQLPGLSISGPIAAFGISCLWQAQFVSRCFTNSDTGLIKLVPVFRFFSILYLVTGIIGYSATRIGTFLGVDDNSQNGDQVEDLGGPVLDDLHRPLLASVPSNLDLTQAETYGSVTDDSNLKNKTNTTKQPSDLKKFFYDPTVWVLFLCFVLTTGPLEMFVNYMGMIVNTIPNNAKFGLPVSTHVSIFSSFSTLARLSVGIISDLLECYISRANFFGIILFVSSLLQFLMATGILTVSGQGKYFFLASASNGFSYGCCFTLTPTIVAAVWGLKNYGTYWGTFILGPSIGATVFGFLFAKVYQQSAEVSQPDINNLEPASLFVARKATELTSKALEYIHTSSSIGLQCYGLKCYQTTFLISGVGFLVAAFLVMGVYRFSWKTRSGLVATV